MSNSAKIWIITAISLILIGAIIFASVMFACGWDFSKLSTADYVTNIHPVESSFDSIRIEVDTTDVEFLTCEYSDCKVEIFEIEKIQHCVTVEDNTLVIRNVDNRKWYDHIGITFNTPHMKIYLPKEVFASLDIKTSTGDVDIPDWLGFENITVNGDTSDVRCMAKNGGNVSIKVDTGDVTVNCEAVDTLDITTSTGDVIVETYTVNGGIKIKTDTGEQVLNGFSCHDLTATSSTGDVKLESVIVNKGITIKTDTGKVTFDGCDADSISVNTSTGDVKGSLLSPKIFATKTSTGSVNVPESVSGGKCDIKTSTGDIKITVK